MFKFILSILANSNSKIIHIKINKEYIHPYVHCSIFTIAKTVTQPKCSLTDDCVKKMWYMYYGILLSQKKDERLPFATTPMNIESILLSELSLIEKHKNGGSLM